MRLAMAALSLVSFAQMQPHAKLSVLQQTTTNSNTDHREIIILRKKVPLNRERPKLSTTPINNNTTTNNNNNNNVKRENENNICDTSVKKKPAVANKGGGVINRNHQLPTVAVARRNARERNRVQQVNKGFETLRQHIPASVASAFTTTESSGSRGASKKLSKVETLRMAVEYIRSLQQILSSDDPDAVLNDHSMTSPLSIVSTSPAPSSSSQNPSVVPTFASYDDHEASPGVLDDDITYDDGDSRDSFGSTQLSGYSRLAPPLNFGIYKKKGNYRDELDENFVPLPMFPNASSPFLNFVGLRDQKDSDENNMFGYGTGAGVAQLTPIHYNPSASLSPGMYSEQSLSPADTDTLTARPKFLPAFSQSLRPPLISSGVDSVIQQTYHVMQQMPVKEEAKEELGPVDVNINWWDNDERIRTSPA